MGGGWLCRHLWEHYRFTLDREFLKTTAYPILRGAAEFYSSWLVDDGSGHLVTPVSSSPENQFRYTGRDGVEKTAGIAMGCTLDMAVIRELFRNVIEAGGMLKLDAELRSKLAGQLDKLLHIASGARGSCWSIIASSRKCLRAIIRLRFILCIRTIRLPAARLNCSKRSGCWCGAGLAIPEHGLARGTRAVLRGWGNRRGRSRVWMR